MNLAIKQRVSFIFFIGIFSMFLGINVIAKTITIKNNSDKPISVVFKAAFGCLGVSLSQTSVCKSRKNIQPHSAIEYKWKWGQAGKKVRIIQDYYIFGLTSKLEGTYSWTGYTGDKGKKEAWRNKDIKPKDRSNFKYVGPTEGLGI